MLNRLNYPILMLSSACLKFSTTRFIRSVHVYLQMEMVHFIHSALYIRAYSFDVLLASLNKIILPVSADISTSWEDREHKWSVLDTTCWGGSWHYLCFVWWCWPVDILVMLHTFFYVICLALHCLYWNRFQRRRRISLHRIGWFTSIISWKILIRTRYHTFHISILKDSSLWWVAWSSYRYAGPI